jgi:hypothetical protein
MDLVVKQNIDRTETVSSSLIDTLYQLTKPDSSTGQPAANAVLVGRIQSAAAYEDAVNFLNTQFSSEQDNGSDLQVSVLNNNYYIRFADPAVEEVLKFNMSKDEGEGITVAEASNTFANYFQGNTNIVSFDELKYFARSSYPIYNFRGCTALKSIDITGKEDVVDCNSDTSIEYFYGIDGPKGFVSTGSTGVGFAGCGGITTLELTCSSNMVTNAYRGMGGLQTLIWKVAPGVIGGPYSFYNTPLLERVIVYDLDSFWTHNMGWGSGSPFQNKIAKLIVNDVEVTSVTVPQTITQIQAGNWRGARLTSCTFHSNITSIGDWAFGECDNLVIQDLNLPNLTTLGSSAFQGTKVQAISNLGSITSIPESCFRSCSQLTSVSTLSSLTNIGANAFISCSQLQSITLPNTLTSIGNYAFRYCSSLTQITLPNSVINIGECAFGNTPITSIIIPPLVTVINKSTFFKCNDLQSVTLQSGITTIGVEAFQQCYSLPTLVLPQTVTEIGTRAFTECSAMSSLIIEATTPPTIGDSLFRNNNCTIYVPSGSVSAYQAASGWSEYASRIQAIPTT